jgi:hypothetical protein
MLNLETSQIVETCEVTFDETQPCSQLVFECGGDNELGEETFQEEGHEHGDDEDGGVVPAVKHVPTTSMMIEDGPSPTPTTTNPDQGEATVEGEVASRREPPRRVQVDHPASRIISVMNECTTRLRVRNNSRFAHASFVATFEPKGIVHALFDHYWVNSMHEELENFERNQVWVLVDPPPGCKPIGTKWVWRNKEGEKGEWWKTIQGLLLRDIVREMGSTMRRPVTPGFRKENQVHTYMYARIKFHTYSIQK